MKIFDNRRARLRQLIAEECQGNQAEFSRRTGIKSPQINRWISTTAADKRNIREESARSIEQLMGLSSGWLDQNASEQFYQTAKEHSEKPREMEQQRAAYAAKKPEKTARRQDDSASMVKLTPDEVTLIAAYRVCNQQGKKAISATAAKMYSMSINTLVIGDNTDNSRQPKMALDLINGQPEKSGIKNIQDHEELLNAVGFVDNGKSEEEPMVRIIPSPKEDTKSPFKAKETDDDRLNFSQTTTGFVKLGEH